MVDAGGTDEDVRLLRVHTFGWFWALAAVLHLLGTNTLSRTRHQLGWLTVVDVGIGLAAAVAMFRPSTVSARTVVLVLSPISAWLGAPVIGNHWLLVALIDLALLSSMVPWLWNRTRSLLVRYHDDGFPAARLMFVCFYVFAAMSKVNSSFLDPTVSCSTTFVGEILGDVGLHSIDPMSGSWWTHLIPLLTVVLELAIAVSLCFGRTRLLGVVTLIAFHGMIALDTTHQFVDFAVIVSALAILFLPDGAFTWLRTNVPRRPLQWSRIVVATIALGLMVMQVLDISNDWIHVLDSIRDVMWWAVWVMLLIAVCVWMRRTHTRRSDVAMIPEQRGLLLWPGIVVLIGIAPYLEIRTATSWNMYSNLVTANGRSNSYVVPVTAHLSDTQADPVRIIDSSDAGLRAYIDTDFEIPWINLRDHTSRSPDASITFERAGVITTIDHTRDDPELSQTVPWWDTKIFSFRSYDENEPSQCQNSMLAAR